MAAEDIYWRIDQAVVASIKALNLMGVSSPDDIGLRVSSELFPDHTDAVYPRIAVTEENEIEERIGQSSAYKEWIRPLRLWILDKESPRMHTKKELYLKWRWLLINEFDNKKLPAVPEVAWCVAVLGVIFNQELPQYQHVVSVIGLRFRTVEMLA